MLKLGKLDQSLDTLKKNSVTNDIVLKKSGGFKTSKPHTNILKDYFSEGKMLYNVNNSHSSSVEDIRKHMLVQQTIENYTRHNILTEESSLERKKSGSR